MLCRPVVRHLFESALGGERATDARDLAAVAADSPKSPQISNEATSPSGLVVEDTMSFPQFPDIATRKQAVIFTSLRRRQHVATPISTKQAVVAPPRGNPTSKRSRYFQTPQTSPAVPWVRIAALSGALPRPDAPAAPVASALASSHDQEALQVHPNSQLRNGTNSGSVSVHHCVVLHVLTLYCDQYNHLLVIVCNRASTSCMPRSKLHLRRPCRRTAISLHEQFLVTSEPAPVLNGTAVRTLQHVLVSIEVVPRKNGESRRDQRFA